MGDQEESMDQMNCRCTFLWFWCCWLCVLSVPKTGWAQLKQNPERIPNLEIKHYDPVISPYGLWGLHTSRGLRHLAFSVGLLNSSANDLLLVQQGFVISRPLQHRITSELAAALGLFSWVEMSLALPIYWRQFRHNFPLVTSGQGYGEQSDTQIGDFRISTKVMLLHNEAAKGFGLSLVLDVTFPTGGKELLMSNSTVTFTPRLVIDYRHHSGLVVAINAGYRFRGNITLFDLTVGDELRLGLGLEVPLFFQGLSVAGEVEMALGLAFLRGESTRPLRADIPTELRLGFRWRHAQSGLLVGLGAGMGLTSGYANPDLRLMFSASWSYDFLRKTPVVSFYHGDFTAKEQEVPEQPTPPQRKPEKQPGTAQSSSHAHQTQPPPIGSISAVSQKQALSHLSRPDPLADDDGDGIPNSVDQCPNEPEDFDGFQDEDGCPDPDNDGDGIPDVVDRCPNQKETFNGYKDDDGCPDVGPSKIEWKGMSGSSGQINIKDKIYFRSGSDQIQPRSMPLLRELAGFLKATWQIRKVQIEGHTDDRGDAEMNVDLSERRARRVMSVLISMQVSAIRLSAKGFGSKMPVTSNRTSSGRAQNRRVIFKVLEIFKPTPTPIPSPKGTSSTTSPPEKTSSPSPKTMPQGGSR